jgi:dipeptidyl aminopeptidase/acylaminoacyl peptidase
MKFALTRLDIAALGASALLGLLISVVLALGNQVGILIDLELSDSGTVGPRGPLTLHFSRPIQEDSIRSLVTFLPEIAGDFRLVDDETIEFIPSEPLLPGSSYQLAVHPGAAGQNGEKIRKEKTFNFQVREPMVVFLNYEKDNLEIFASSLDSQTKLQLTHTNNRVFDFAASPNGEWVAYTMINDKKGIDLWIVSRDGDQNRKLLDCDEGQCEAPAWSPDSRQIAFSRKMPSLQPGVPPGLPRPWLLDVTTAEAKPLFSDQQLIGYGASWSPDGQWLATIDGIAPAVHVLNIKTGQDVFLPSNTGALPSWSPDSRYLFFTTVELKNERYRTLIKLADFSTGEIATFLGDETDSHDYSYGVPAWSPNGEQILLSYKPEADSADRFLWLVQPDLIAGPTISAERGFSFSFYHWDPWGKTLIFQRLQLGSKYNPQIAVWKPGKELLILAEPASFPQWLP